MNRSTGSHLSLVVWTLGGIAVITALPSLFSFFSSATSPSSWWPAVLTLMLAIATSITGLIVLRRALFDPLGRIAGVVKEASSGQGNLAQNLELSNNSVLGLIGRNYNAFLGKLREMLDIIRRQAVR
ncbi:MAG: hypothetical protein ACM3SV_06115, partial [Betaproteobacteria bacterium]